MGFLKDLVHSASANPVTQIATKVDPLAKGVDKTLTKAVDIGYGKPLTGKDESGLDVIGAGPIYQAFGIGGNPEKPEDRAVGRAVGGIFAGYGIGEGASAVGLSSSTVSTAKTVISVGEAYDAAKASRNATRSVQTGAGSLPVPLAFDFSTPLNQAALDAPDAPGLASSRPPASSSSSSLFPSSSAWLSWAKLALPLIGLAFSLNSRHA